MVALMSLDPSLEVELAGIRQRLGDELYAELVERNRDDLD